LGQEGGEAKIASGRPPGSIACFGCPFLLGCSMSARSVQAPMAQHLAASASTRRRSLPPSLSVPMSQSVNQRWRERPRCPALRVTPGSRDGAFTPSLVVSGYRRLRTSVVQEERAAHVHVRAAGFTGTT